MNAIASMGKQADAIVSELHSKHTRITAKFQNFFSYDNSKHGRCCDFMLNPARDLDTGASPGA
jgi:hypothetical protein